MRKPRSLKDQRGVASLEFAIVVLLLLTMVYGLITFGFIFALNHNLSLAASEGARSAIQRSHTSATNADIETFAESNALQRMSFQAAKTHAVVDAQVDPCANDPAVDCITVTIDYDWDTHPIVPELFGVGTPNTLNATAVVQLD